MPDHLPARGALRPREAAAYLSISTRELARRTAAREIRVMRMGPRLVRYRLVDLDQWLDRHAVR